MIVKMFFLEQLIPLARIIRGTRLEPGKSDWRRILDGRFWWSRAEMGKNRSGRV